MISRDAESEDVRLRLTHQHDSKSNCMCWRTLRCKNDWQIPANNLLYDSYL